MSNYVDEVLEYVKRKDPNETEFIQTVTEVLDSLRPLVEEKEKLLRDNIILERLVEPEKIVAFRVPWVDDAGVWHVNRGWRVQFNSALGPYKGGLRFKPTVNLSILKFLAFEQTFKNCLTGRPIGGGKGGSDFDPKGKSDGEIMRFCQSFITGLYQNIGPNLDVPAGDIGVGSKEIGYMFGQYKRIVGAFENGALTGKATTFGGCFGRDTSTGYGAVYFTKSMLNANGRKVRGSTFALSGYGNVAWGAAKKLSEKGAKVLSISGSDGYIYDPDGVSGEKVDYMLDMRNTPNRSVKLYADKFGVPYFPGEKPWGRVKADYYMPCGTQNEVTLEDAQRMIDEGTCDTLIEVSNMPTTPDAINLLKAHNWTIAPSKAVNAAGVACSAIEMSQNAMKRYFTAEEVDGWLRTIMANIYDGCATAAAKYGKEGDLMAGANLCATEKIIDAMVGQGVC